MTRWIADSIAEERGWAIPAEGALRSYFEERVARGEREVATRVRADLNWDDQPAPTHRMFAPEAFNLDQATEAAHMVAPVPIMDVFEAYLAEQRPTAKTAKKWRTALSSLIQHLGHDDAARVTRIDIVSWKDALLLSEGGVSLRGPGTVRNGYLGAVRPVFGWAKENGRILSNPVAGVTVRLPRKETNRFERGYSSAEAKLVLRAALATSCEVEVGYGAFARRWLPWLCAYTGARVVEMAQLRRSDVAQSEDGIWHLKIMPNAGSQKSRKARRVALHPHLIEQGFLEAIRNRTGPLFFDPARRKANSTGNSQAQKVAQRVADWVRALGITDPELQPNHGWRHAFVTNARGKIDEDVRRDIVGHFNKSEHGKYGNTTLEVMHEALQRFPRYSV